MGNVHAASNTTTSVPCPPIQPVSPPSPPPPKVSSILVPVENVNPGTFEDLHRQCKGKHYTLYLINNNALF